MLFQNLAGFGRVSSISYLVSLISLQQKGGIINTMKKMTVLLFMICAATCAFAQQQAVSLDEAINNAMWDLIDLLPTDVKVGLTEFTTPAEPLTQHLKEQVSALLDRAHITIVATDQVEQDRIDAELFRQLSLADEDQAHGLGHQYATDVLVSGTFRDRGDGYYGMVLTSSHVETAEKHTSTPQRVMLDGDLARLIGVKYISPAAWKQKWLYIGGAAGYGLEFSWAGMIDVQVASFLAITLEVGQQGFYYEDVVRYDTAYDKDIYADKFSSVLTGSLFPSITLRPGGLSLELYGGPYYALDEKIGFGVAAGASVGYKLGPGIIFADGRYGVWAMNSQQLLNFSLGYKIGFLSKKN
jgi:hypothetical protein